MRRTFTDVHELSISQAVLDTALAHADGRRVTRVDMTVGALRLVVPDSLSFYFEIVSRDTACDGAALHITEVPGVVRCERCEEEWELDLPAFRCARCGGGVEVVSGNELAVESIEVEEDACIAAP
jgi:hydrogenase nickel incorporation protein HypA/HybF